MSTRLTSSSTKSRCGRIDPSVRTVIAQTLFGWGGIPLTSGYRHRGYSLKRRVDGLLLTDGRCLQSVARILMKGSSCALCETIKYTSVRPQHTVRGVRITGWNGVLVLPRRSG